MAPPTTSPSTFDLRPSTSSKSNPSSFTASDPRSGSALIMVLAVSVVIGFLIANFGADLRSELRAAGGFYENAMNQQAARSALALARLELGQSNPTLYANGHGDAYLISGTEDYESAIEELQEYRDGYQQGRGYLSYRLVYTPSALDPNQLNQTEWHRLFEVACDLDEGEERTTLVDSILDWMDADSLARASGAEETDYQDLESPRHAKNGELDSAEELLLVLGMTPELFYGDGIPLREENDMLYGGGLLRHLIGDNSPAGRAAAQYVLTGQYPVDDSVDEDEELEYNQVNTRPETLYLIAQGYMTDSMDEDSALPLIGETRTAAPAYHSRHIMLATLSLNENSGTYTFSDIQENASSEAIERLLAYGIEEEL